MELGKPQALNFTQRYEALLVFCICCLHLLAVNSIAMVQDFVTRAMLGNYLQRTEGRISGRQFV